MAAAKKPIQAKAKSRKPAVNKATMLELDNKKIVSAINKLMEVAKNSIANNAPNKFDLLTPRLLFKDGKFQLDIFLSDSDKYLYQVKDKPLSFACLCLQSIADIKKVLNGRGVQLNPTWVADKLTSYINITKPNIEDDSYYTLARSVQQFSQALSIYGMDPESFQSSGISLSLYGEAIKLRGWACGRLGIDIEGIKNKAVSDMQRNAANARHKDSNAELQFIKDCWVSWQKNKASYKNATTFCNDMLDKCEHHTSHKVLTEYCTDWKKELAKK